jgi:hypothetical protein
MANIFASLFLASLLSNSLCPFLAKRDNGTMTSSTRLQEVVTSTTLHIVAQLTGRQEAGPPGLRKARRPVLARAPSGNRG